MAKKLEAWTDSNGRDAAKARADLAAAEEKIKDYSADRRRLENELRKANEAREQAEVRTGRYELELSRQSEERNRANERTPRLRAAIVEQALQISGQASDLREAQRRYDVLRADYDRHRRDVKKKIENDERVKAWEEIVQHPAFIPCYSEGDRLLPAMQSRLSDLVRSESDANRGTF